MSVPFNVAVVDCGSNSTRLLIASNDGVTLAREMRITRLSQGVDSARNLTSAALQRSYDVLASYRSVMDEYHVERGLLVATSAVRDATNPLFAAILRRFRDATGLPVLINTSFNVHEEPIVNRPDECLKALVDGRVDFVVTRQAVYTIAG